MKKDGKLYLELNKMLLLFKYIKLISKKKN